jgi:hypothetical protein
MVERLNRMIIGWANYFCLGPVGKAYSAVDLHARRRLRRWLCDKYKEPRPAYKRFPESSLHSVYDSVQLPHRTEVARRKPSRISTGRLQSLRLLSTLLAIELKFPGDLGTCAQWLAVNKLTALCDTCETGR